MDIDRLIECVTSEEQAKWEEAFAMLEASGYVEKDGFATDEGLSWLRALAQNQPRQASDLRREGCVSSREFPHQQLYHCPKCNTGWLQVSTVPILNEPHCPECEPDGCHAERSPLAKDIEPGPASYEDEPAEDEPAPDYAAITREIAAGG